MRALHSGSFLPGRRNIVLVGGTGTGKTHLAIAITAHVIRTGARGRYFNTVDLVTRREEETRAHPASLSRALLGAGFRYKNSCWHWIAGAMMSARHGGDGGCIVSRACVSRRTGWSSSMRRRPDEMTRLHGRARQGQRLKGRAPFGHWKTQTVVAGLRCDGLTAPWIIDRPLTKEIFEIYVETQLAPTLGPGDPGSGPGQARDPRQPAEP